MKSRRLNLHQLNAESNDSPSGGGARDFRFGSYKKVLPAIKKMFPNSTTKTRKRTSVAQQVEVFQGTFSWMSKGKEVRKESFFETPTDVRPSEGRIARVHEYECFNADRIPTATPDNRVLLLLIQRADGTVWPHYVEEKSLRTPGAWDKKVAKELIDCLDAERSKATSVIGYYDFEFSEKYCNGK
jgi:hypothetical protein